MELLVRNLNLDINIELEVRIQKPTFEMSM